MSEIPEIVKKFNKIKAENEKKVAKDPTIAHFAVKNPDMENERIVTHDPATKNTNIYENSYLNGMESTGTVTDDINPKVLEAEELLAMDFEDIMKKLGLEKDTVYYDTQEVAETVAQGEELIEGMIRKKLVVGDIVFNDLLIERKTVKDFIDSIIDGRLDFQCNKMIKYGYKKRVILIEGNYKEHLELEGGIHPHAYLAKKASISQSYDVEIQDVADNYDFWYTVKKLIEKNPKKREINLKVNIFDKHKHWNPEVAMLASGFDGIAEKKAELILSKYKIKDLYNISREDLEEIKGIGPKISEIIKDHFN